MIDSKAAEGVSYREELEAHFSLDELEHFFCDTRITITKIGKEHGLEFMLRALESQWALHFSLASILSINNVGHCLDQLVQILQLILRVFLRLRHRNRPRN